MLKLKNRHQGIGKRNGTKSDTNIWTKDVVIKEYKETVENIWALYMNSVQISSNQSHSTSERQFQRKQSIQRW